MTYIKVAWTHNFDDEPVELLSELDAQRLEIRKVERFRNGALNFAGQNGASGETRLSETPLPSLEVIAEDARFKPLAIDRDEFEQAWRAARVALAA